MARHGRRVLLAGAIIGTLPDLDLITYPLMGDVGRFVSHRGPTHSLILIPLAAPLLAALLVRFRNGFGLSRSEWQRLLFWCLGTHVLLDLCTTYGTKIFWPLSAHPVALSIVFIIDPFYSVILLAALGWILWRLRRGHQDSRRIAALALVLSSSYLLLAGGLKLYALDVFRDALHAHDRRPLRVMVQNSPFNILLWRGIAVDEGGGVATGWFSVLRDRDQVKLSWLPASPAWSLQQEPELAGNLGLARLIAFSKGFYRIEQSGTGLFFTDLRFGVPGLRPMRFHFADYRDGAIIPRHPIRRVPLWDWEAQPHRWRDLLQRL